MIVALLLAAGLLPAQEPLQQAQPEPYCDQHVLVPAAGFESDGPIVVTSHVPGGGSSDHCHYRQSPPGSVVIEAMLAQGDDDKQRYDRCYWSCRERLYDFLGRQDWNAVARPLVGGRRAFCVRRFGENTPSLPAEELCLVQSDDSFLLIHLFAAEAAPPDRWHVSQFVKSIQPAPGRAD